MNVDIRVQATALAARPYLVYVEGDFSNPSEPLYVAYHPEMPRCVAQGTTADEAQAILSEVVVEHIEYLLTNGLPVPDPTPVTGYTAPSGKPPVTTRGYAIITVGEGTTIRFEPVDMQVVPHA